MMELERGHVYLLDNLKSTGGTVLTFYKDPALHNGIGAAGPSTQEVVRATIERVKALDAEVPAEENQKIIFHLRSAIALFEIRALRRLVEKGHPIENFLVNSSGHIFQEPKP